MAKLLDFFCFEEFAKALQKLISFFCLCSWHTEYEKPRDFRGVSYFKIWCCYVTLNVSVWINHFNQAFKFLATLFSGPYRRPRSYSICWVFPIGLLRGWCKIYFCFLVNVSDLFIFFISQWESSMFQTWCQLLKLLAKNAILGIIWLNCKSVATSFIIHHFLYRAAANFFKLQ